MHWQLRHALLTISAVILTLMPGRARADAPLRFNDYRPLISVRSGKCFEPFPAGTSINAVGRPIQQRACSPGITQSTGSIDRKNQWYNFQYQGPINYNDQGWCPTWLCIARGTTGYLIRNLDTDLCLEVRDGSKNSGAIIQQATCDRTIRRMLWFVESGDFADTFKVRNFRSELCLDLKGGSFADYTQLQQYRCTSYNLAQNFNQDFLRPRMILDGWWSDGDRQSALISSGAFGHIVIDMSAFYRPTARGYFGVSTAEIQVNFPDDRTYRGEIFPFQLPTKITWSNGSVWLKKP